MTDGAYPKEIKELREEIAKFKNIHGRMPEIYADDLCLLAFSDFTRLRYPALPEKSSFVEFRRKYWAKTPLVGCKVVFDEGGFDLR